MALVTDSFCERCGTRYVFQAPASKTLSMKSARVLAKGLRNFVMNDGQSLEDSIHAARNEDSSADSSRLTQAFHRAFNFCMSCRQYACERCWDPKSGTCLSCSPLAAGGESPEHEHLIARTAVTRLDVDDRGPFPPAQAPADAASLPSPLPTQASYAGPAAFGGPASSGGTASFSAGRLTSMPNAEPETSQTAWPEADRMAPQADPAAADADPVAADADASLFDFGAEPARPAARAPEWVLRRGSTDGETVQESADKAWSQWPISDPLAPEATLTPEELSLVEAHLSRSDSDLEAEPEPMAAMTAEAEVTPEPTMPVIADLSPSPILQPAPMPILRPLTPAPVLPAPPAAAQAFSEPAASSPAGVVPQVQGNDQAALPMAFMALRGTPSNGVWPHPTLWLDRPNKSYSPIFDSETEPANVAVVADEYAAGPATAAADVRTTYETAGNVEAEPAPEPVAATPPTPAAFVPASEPEPMLAPAPVPAPVPEPVVVPAQPLVFREVPVEVAWQQGLAGAQTTSRPDAVPVAPQPVVPQPVVPQPVVPQPVAPQPVAPQPIAPQPVFAIQPPAGRPASLPPAPTQPLAPYQPAPAPQAPAYPAPSNSGWPPLGAQWPAPVSQGPVWPAPQGLPGPAVALTAKAAATTEMWTQSAQEVMNRGSVRVCHHCSLPLSTQARFCRRCGTSQT